MGRLKSIFALVTGIFLVLSGSANAHESDDHAESFRALVFSKVTYFYHDSIPAGQALIEQLGEEHNFEVVISDDATLFNDEDLATFDVVIFNNVNSRPQEGNALNAEQREAFQRYIRSGGGYTGIHAATATERDWPWYFDMVGAQFTYHPPGENPDGTIDGRIKVTDRVHPSTRDLPELWEFEEEWYNWDREVNGDVHVLASIDTKVGITGLDQGPDHPLSWCQNFEGGRSWYSAIGHSSAAFSNEEYAKHLLGGIEWAAGRAEGDCGATENTSFDKVLIADNPADPMAVDFLSRDEVLFIERGGAVKVVDQTDLSVTTAGTIPVYTVDSAGLLGVAVDPDYATTRWIYFMYSNPDTSQMQVSRFTMGENNQLDLDSEVVLLEIPTFRGDDRSGGHLGGIIKFDDAGNLYIGTGDNIDPFESDGYAPIDERSGREHYDAQGTSGNTADLRGKILRITPQPDGSYTVPDDNLFTSGAHDDLFPGGTYDPDLGSPEIFVMGLRNPFRFTVDKPTGTVMLTDHSSDARSDSATRGTQAHGKWMAVDEATNLGWPYCIGAELPFVDYDFATGESGETFDCANLINDSPNNTGLEQLPPTATPDMVQRYSTTPDWPEFGTGGIAPVGGPVYHYDETLDSTTKFPEYYDGKWFIGEWDRNWIKTVSFLSQDQSFDRYESRDAGYPYSIDPWGEDQTWVRPMDMEFGPDGALYVIEWGSNFGGNLRGQPNDDSGVYRLDYVAGNRPPTAQISATPSNGQAPLTVDFSSEGSGHPLGLPVTMEWEFGDGTTSTEANPSHTYPDNGEYTARLTVTDDEDRTAMAVVDIVVGNTRPEVTLVGPPDGGFYDFGDTIPYEVAVTDAEDGSIADGGIACEDVVLQTLLGHDEHAHPLETFDGCTGDAPTLTDGGHGEDQNLYYVLEGIYVDGGGDGVGTLTGADAARLRTKHAEAEHYSTANGVEVLDRDTASAGARLGAIRPGDWVAFDPVNFYGIDSVTVGASSGGQGGYVEFRAGSPDGTLLGQAEIDSNGDWNDVREFDAALTDPGETFELYVVFQGLPDYTSSGPDLLALDYLHFNGAGVSEITDDPRVSAEASPKSGTAPLDVTLSGSATSPVGNDLVSYDWDLGDGSSATGESVDHTYTEPGSYDAVLTVTDSEGLTGSGSVTVDVDGPQPPVCSGPLSDEFDGDSLDHGRWSEIVREDTSGYSVGGGTLTLPTVAGRIYSTQENDSPNIILQPAPDGEWEATTKVTVAAAHQWQKAGIMVYSDDDNYARANIVGTAGTSSTPVNKFEFIYESDATPRNDSGDSTGNLPADFPSTFYLKVASDGTDLTAAYSTDGVTWEPFGRTVPVAGLTDPKIGLFANKSHTDSEVIDAEFDWFRVSPDAPAVDVGPDDEFDAALDGCRWDRVIRPEVGDFWLADGRLNVNTTDGANYGGNNQPLIENQFLQTADPAEDWVIETKVDAPLDHQYQQAGLQYYEDDGTYVKLDVVADNAPGSDTSLRVELRSEIDDAVQSPQPDMAAPDNADTEWWLRLTKTGTTFSGSVSADGETWVDLPDTVDNAGFTDGAYGIVHQSRVQEGPVTLGFDYFRVSDPVQLAEVSSSVTPAEPDGADGWYVSPATLSLEATDPAAEIEYRVGDGDWTSYAEPLVLDADGVHDVAYRATNAAGTSDPASLSLALDVTEPSTTAEVAGELDLDVYLGTATVTLEGTDDGSGLAETHYRLTDEQDHTVYEGPVSLPPADTYEIDYRSADTAGNVGEWQPAEVIVAEPTVIVGGVDSGVTNRAVSSGTTINDLIIEQGWPNHGQFIRHVSEVTSKLRDEGVINGRERGQIVSTAASKLL